MPGFNPREEQGGVKIKDEGVTLVGKASSIDFTGGGVTGSALASEVTEHIPGSGGGGTVDWIDITGTQSNINVGGFTNDVGYLTVETDPVFTGSDAFNTVGTNTGDQVGDGVTITGAGTIADPFVSIGGGGTPGGADTNIQYNDGGVLGGDAGMTWNKNTNTATFNSLAFGYSMTPAALTISGTDYNFSGDGYAGCLFLNSLDMTGDGPDITGVVMPSSSVPVVVGNEDIGVGVGSLFIEGDYIYITIYFNNSLFADQTAMETWWATFAGPGAWTTVYFKKSMWTNNGTGFDLTWANPDSQTITTGYTDPPTLVYGAVPPTSVVISGGNIALDGRIDAQGVIMSGGDPYGGQEIQVGVGGQGVLGLAPRDMTPSNDQSWDMLYTKTDGQLYFLDTTNVEYNLTSPTVVETDPYSLHLDQSVQQTIINGIPIFGSGLQSDSDIVFSRSGAKTMYVQAENLGDTPGSTLLVMAGAGAGTGAGGQLSLFGGYNSTQTVAGGRLILQGALIGQVDLIAGQGGVLNIFGADNSAIVGDNAGGDINLTGGANSGSALPGAVKIISRVNSYNAAVFDTTPLQAERTYEFPDKSGTFAMTSDISGGTPPAGNTTEVQFNNNGSFGASSNFRFDSNILWLGSAGEGSATGHLALMNSTAGYYSEFTASDTQAGDILYTLPPTKPTTGLNGFLKSDDAGVMSWDTSTYLTDISGQDLSTADNSTSAFITGADVTANETDPVFSAWLIATPPLYSETDPVYSGSEAANITSTDITNLGNLSGTNTGDEAYTNATPTDVTLGGIPSGSTFSAETMTDMWDMLLYPYQLPAFTSFAGLTTLLEVGDSTAANPTFTWATSNSANVEVNSIDIDDDSAPVNIVTGTANDGSYAATFAAITRTNEAGELFRITGTNTNSATFSRYMTVYWRYRYFYGTSASATLDEAGVEGLVGNVLANQVTAPVGTYAFAAGDYKWICFPGTWGSFTTFKDASTNLDVPFESPTTVSVTNAFGQGINYKCYRSTNILGAAISIIAS